MKRSLIAATVMLGIAWFVLAFVVLTVDAASVWTVAILAAIAFIVGGVFELVLASMVRSWKRRWRSIGGSSRCAPICPST